jgi:lysophospholipase L1-like esterase
MSTLLLAALTATSALAQPAATGPVGLVAEPCAAPVAMPESARALLYDLFMEPRTLQAADIARLVADPGFAEYISANRGAPGQDWPGLCRFRAANAALLASGNTPRVVFMGDSITENWTLGDPELFSADFVNRGISAQTTPQMLVRFRADVVALKPAMVHIMAGTNDVAGNTGPSTMQDVKNNVMAMVELAQANGIGVLLASIPPAARFDWQPALKPAPQIRELNAWLQEYAQQRDIAYIDYHSALAGPDGELRAELGNDGVHPNREGYVIMRRLLESAVAAATR